MSKPNRGTPSSALLTSSLVAAAFAAALAAGCAMPVQDELPATHLDQAGEVARSHDRCGACHPNGTRGNGTYNTLDGAPMESLPESEFAMPDPPEEAKVTESLDIEMPTGEEE